MRWYLQDPATGVVWAMRPSRAYHPECRAWVGPRPLGGQSSDEEGPPAELAAAAGPLVEPAAQPPVAAHP
eukprot:6568197-Lingulodinium_polyedra.AAC.1